MSKCKVDIHFVSWERPAITELSIRTIARNTKSGSYRLLVLDNGSSTDTKTMLKTLKNEGLIDKLIFNPINVGLESARNTLLSMTESKYFICADNDCLPEPIRDGKDWIERLVELIDTNPVYGAISCRTQVMVGTGNIFEDESKDIAEFPHPGGSFRIMRYKDVEAIGGWEGKPGRGSEEKYICGELHKYGYSTGFATHISTLHLFGVRKDATDRWGYPEDWAPDKTGHSDISHPALTNGDNFEEVKKYSGKYLAEEYFNVDRSN
jgi:glycosyltransferase involved in cell wall biosynthesis